MGLFDDFYFDPATYGGSQGLLGILRAGGPAPTVGNDQPNPLDTAQYPAGPMAPPASDYGQTRTVQIGSGPSAYSLPIFGNPPAQNPAAIPPNAQPTAGQLPQATQQAPRQVPGADPSFGDRLQAGLNGFIGNAHTGPIGAILGGIGGLANGVSPGNQTLQVLTAHGLDPQTAQTVARDPALLRAVLPALIKTGAGGTEYRLKDHEGIVPQRVERARGRPAYPSAKNPVPIANAPSAVPKVDDLLKKYGGW